MPAMATNIRLSDGSDGGKNRALSELMASEPNYVENILHAVSSARQRQLPSSRDGSTCCPESVKALARNNIGDDRVNGGGKAFPPRSGRLNYELYRCVTDAIQCAAEK